MADSLTQKLHECGVPVQFLLKAGNIAKTGVKVGVVNLIPRSEGTGSENKWLN